MYRIPVVADAGVVCGGGAETRDLTNDFANGFVLQRGHARTTRTDKMRRWRYTGGQDPFRLDGADGGRWCESFDRTTGRAR